MKAILLSVLIFSLGIPLAVGKDQWVILGDSLSVGIIGNGSQFTKEVKERWNRDIEVINLSRVGKHTHEYKKEINGILAQFPDARYFPIFCGVNDVLNYSKSTANQLRSWLVYVLKAIKNAGRTPILMRITYRNYKGQDPLEPFNPRVYDPLIKTYSPRWYDYAKKRGLLDPHGFLKSHPQYVASDGVHLTSQGYRAFRKEIMLEAMMEPVYAKDHQRDLNETREPDHLTFDDLALKASPTPEVDDFSGPAKSSKNDVPAIIATPKVTPTQQLKQELLDASSTTDPIMRGIHLSRASLLLRELWQAGELSEENKGDIQDFQRALKVYGVGIEKVEGTYDSKTREAGQGLRVMMAQTYLKKRGLYPFEINGVLDEKTTAALKQYAQNRFLDPQEPDLLPGIIKRLAREHNR